MDTVKLKSDLHKLVDDIQNVQLLQAIHDFLKSGNRSKNGKMWDSLTEEERNQVILAFEESEEDYNLIRQKDAFKKP